MRVVKIERSIMFDVQTDGEYNTSYRRGEYGGWECLYGSSWESVWDDAEIEDAFRSKAQRIGMEVQ